MNTNTLDKAIAEASKSRKVRLRISYVTMRYLHYLVFGCEGVLTMYRWAHIVIDDSVPHLDWIIE